MGKKRGKKKRKIANNRIKREKVAKEQILTSVKYVTKQTFKVESFGLKRECWQRLVKKRFAINYKKKVKNKREVKVSQTDSRQSGEKLREREKEIHPAADSFCCHSQISIASRKVSSGIAK